MFHITSTFYPISGRKYLSIISMLICLIAQDGLIRVVSARSVADRQPIQLLQTVEEQVEQGRSYLQEGRYEDAIDILNEVLDSDPNNVWALVWRGEAYRLLEFYEEAIVDLKQAIRLDSENDLAFAIRGIAYQELGQYNEALNDLNQAIELDPEDSWALAHRGDVYYELERYEEALADLDKAIKLDSKYFWALALRGQVYQQMDEYTSALLDFSRAIAIDPQSAWVYRMRGETYRFAERYDDALDDLNKALELIPDYVWALAERGKTYQEMELYDQSLEDFTNAMELDPEYSWLYTQRGRTYQLMEEHEKAIADFTRSLELAPENDWVLAQRARSYQLLEEYELAVKDYSSAIEIDPDYVWALAQRGKTHKELGNYEEAVDDFTRAIELDPEYVWALAQRADTYQILEEYEAAFEDVDLAIELDPDYDWSYAVRGNIYRQLELYEEALADFTQAIELNPDYAWAFTMRGEIYQELGETDKAIADFNQAALLKGSDPSSEEVSSEEVTSTEVSGEEAISEEDSNDEESSEEVDSEEVSSEEDSDETTTTTDTETTSTVQNIGNAIGNLTQTAKPVQTRREARQAVVQIVAVGQFADPEEGSQVKPGTGTGFIIDPAGIAVTNNHVVTGAAFLEVYIQGEEEPRNARVLGVSECADLAVIDIEGKGYPYLEWSTDSIEVGLDVYAAGFPLGDPEYTLTRGIISKERADGQTRWASLPYVLEHDATINPGNSGGPLIDENGRVVAVNYAKDGRFNQYFAISRDLAIPIVEELRTGVDMEGIGINGEAMIFDEDLTGIWIASVKSGSPADRVGIQGGDILIEFEGLAPATDGTMETYCDILRSHSLDDVMDIAVFRTTTSEILEGQLNGEQLANSSGVAPTQAPAQVARGAGREPEPEADAKSDDVLFWDDFSSNVNDWPIDEYSTSFAESEELIDDGRLVWRSAFKEDASTWAWIPDLSLKTFYLSMELELIEAPRDQLTNVIFLFRAQDNDNFYMIRINNNGEYLVGGQFDGEWQTIEEWTESDAFRLRRGQINQVELLVTDDEFTFAVDGQTLTAIENLSLNDAGQIGFGLSGLADTTSAIAVDNLLVRAVEPPRPTVQEAATPVPASETSFDSVWIQDEAGLISVRVPEAWSDVEDISSAEDTIMFGAATPDESAGALVTAFLDESVRLLNLEAILELVQEGMIEETPELFEGCVDEGQFEYENRRYTGVYQTWSNCAEEENEIYSLAVIPKEGEDVILWVFAYFSDQSGVPIVNSMMDSLTVSDITATTTGPTPRPRIPTATPTPQAPTIQAHAIVQVATLNIRSGPGTNYTRIGSIPQGTQLPVLGKIADCAWLQIQTPNGEIGWVAGPPRFTRLEGNCAAIDLIGEVPNPPPVAAKPCIRFVNHFNKEAIVTMTGNGREWTFTIGKSGRHTERFEPDIFYTYTVSVPNEGSINGDFALSRGQCPEVPIYREFN